MRTMIALQVVFAVGDSCAQFAFAKIVLSVECLQGLDAQCTRIFHTSALVEVVFQIVTDLIISLLPITFVVQLRRPVWEKILICVLMAMGLLVGGVSIRKLIYFLDTSVSPEEALSWTAYLDLFSCAEMHLSVLAACMPRLKAPLEKLLGRCGIDVTALRQRHTPIYSNNMPDLQLPDVEPSKSSDGKSSSR